VIDHIRTKLGFLIQMVNLNVSGRQYVCAGDRRSLEVLQKVTDRLHAEPRLLESLDAVMLVASAECEVVGQAVMTKVLLRGRATVPLNGIDVPFHSQLLASMKGLFRSTLEDGIDKSAVRADDLKGRWIPNVTGTPFSTEDAFVKSVYELTGCRNLSRWYSKGS
jgi:fatty acid synthase subunit beta